MICTNNDLFEKETSYLRNLFQKNGYSSWFFDQSVKKFDDKNKLDTQKPKADFFRSIEVPYYGKSSSRFANRLVKKKFYVDLSVYYTNFKFGAYFQLALLCCLM